MISSWCRNWPIVLALALPLGAHADHPFAGYDYASGDWLIKQFKPSGEFVRSMNANCADDGEPRGIGFGPDGLYVVCSRVWSDSSVQVLNAAGEVVKSYPFKGDTSVLATSGALRFSPDMKHFYVSTVDGIFRFAVDGMNGTRFVRHSSTALDVMPNGDLLVGDGHVLVHYTADGVEVGKFSKIADPHHLAPDYARLYDVRGVVYDARTDTTFVTMLGYSDFYHQVLAFEGTSKVLKGLTTYWYGNDLNITADGLVLVGSGAQQPGIFSVSNTVPMVFTLSGTLDTPGADFVSSRPPKSR